LTGSLQLASQKSLSANASKSDDFSTQAASSNSSQQAASLATTNAAQAAEASNRASATQISASKNSASTHDVSKSNDFDTSTVASLAATKSDVSSSSAVKNTAIVDNVQGAVTLADADATNIAVDGSTINSTTNYSVTLAGSAEANAKALNIVNAAGGMVANGVNIAHSSNMNAIPTLNQTNSIAQLH
jgi:hypothetical protein